MKVLKHSWTLTCLVQLYIVSVAVTSVAINMRYPGNACTKPRLVNGVVLARNQGRTVVFKCSDGFKIWGSKRGTCVLGAWSVIGNYPVCAKRGCRSSPPSRNVAVKRVLDGSILRFNCQPGYKLHGSEFIYCDGYRWNDTTPKCLPETAEPAISCDFESDDLCGWSQDEDDHFEWKRHQGATPSGNVGTGPSFDHTLGQGKDGHYMYIESSSPRLKDDTARLVSPVYPPALSNDGCFIFWYHMYGVSIGSLKVYLKQEETRYLVPILTLTGQRGNVWLRRVVRLRPTIGHFQIIIDAVIGDGYVGDAAIDDVTLANGTDCIEPITEPPSVIDGRINGVLAASQSCQNRCTATSPAPSDLDTTFSFTETAHEVDTFVPETPVLLACECTASCLDNMETCCQDFATYCIAAKMTTSALDSADYQTTGNTPQYFPPSPPLPPLPPKPDIFTTTLPFTSNQPITIVTYISTQLPSTTTTITTIKETVSTTTPTTTISTTDQATTTRATTAAATTTRATTRKPAPTRTTTVRTTPVSTSTTTTTPATTQTTKMTTRSTPSTSRTTTTGTTRSTTTVAPRITSTAPTVTTAVVTTSAKKQSVKTVKPYIDSKPNKSGDKDTKKKDVAEKPKEEGLLQPPSTAGWTSTPALAGLIAGVVLLVLLTTLTMIVVVVRRRRLSTSSTRHHMADDSDVRFLTAEEVLDFSLARPRENDDRL